MAEPQSQQKQQSGPTGNQSQQNAQTMITQIEGTTTGQFACSSELAHNVLLPALKAWNRQQT